MKFCAYIAICLCLPFVLIADEAADAAGTSPDAAEESKPDEGGLDRLGPGFERFKTILERMPFGRPPPGFNPDAPGNSAASASDGGKGAGEEEVPVSEMEQQILSSVRVSALNVSPSGTIVVGFTDSSVQPPRNYLMEVGEKRGEWTVVAADADPLKKMVKLSKGGVEVTLKLGGGSAEGSGDANKATADAKTPNKPSATGKPSSLTGRSRPNLLGRRAADHANGDGPKLSGLEIARARRQQRRAEQEAEAAQRRQAAEQERKEREQAQKEREQAAEERKAQLAQLQQIQDELRRQREEKQAEEARRAAAGEVPPPPPDFEN